MADVINKKSKIAWSIKPVTNQYSISASKPDSARDINDGSGYGQGTNGFISEF